MDQVSYSLLQSSEIEISLLGGITYEEFKKIFSSNLNVLEDYVLENTSVDTIEKWTHKKAKKLNKKAKPTRGKNTLDNWKVMKKVYQTCLKRALQFSVKADKQEMLKEMMTHIMGTTNKGQIMYELSSCICHAVDADLLNLYLVETDGEITRFIPQGEKRGL